MGVKLVSNVNFNGSYYSGQSYIQDLNRVACYTVGLTRPEEEGPFAGFATMGYITLGLGGFQVIPALLNAKKQPGGLPKFWADQGDIYNKELTNVRGRLQNLGNADTYKNFWSHFSIDKVKETIPGEEKLAKLTDLAYLSTAEGEKAKKAFDVYDRAKEVIGRAGKNPEESSKLLKEARQLITEGDALSHGLIKAEGKWGKFVEGFGKYTGTSKISGALKNLAAKSPAAASSLRFVKRSGGILALLSVVPELFKIIPAFGLGADKGVKQLCKSGIGVAANLGGWVAGETAGMAIGSFICPGVGTLLGGVAGMFIGMIGGTLGAWAADKIVSPICGKSEVDVAKEEQAQKLAQEASQSPEVAQQLMQAAAQKIQQEGADSEEAKLAFGSLQKLAQLSQQQNQTQTPTNNYQYAQYSPSTTGNNPFSQQDYMNKDFMAMAYGLA